MRGAAFAMVLREDLHGFFVPVVGNEPPWALRQEENANGDKGGSDELTPDRDPECGIRVNVFAS